MGFLPWGLQRTMSHRAWWSHIELSWHPTNVHVSVELPSKTSDSRFLPLSLWKIQQTLQSPIFGHWKCVGVESDEDCLVVQARAERVLGVETPGVGVAKKAWVRPRRWESRGCLTGLWYVPRFPGVKPGLSRQAHCAYHTRVGRMLPEERGCWLNGAAEFPRKGLCGRSEALLALILQVR